MKINHPVEGFTGTTRVGPFELVFKDGTAESDELNKGAKAYLKGRGYGFGSKRGKRPDAEQRQPADPRKVSTEQVGDPVRDAAVDPRKGDFLAPTNAGKDNPHGTEVVSPEIHGSQGVRPVKPGDAHVGDPDAQDAAEKAHTAASTAPEPAEELKGAALDAALEERGLSKSGTADEKRARVAEHDAGATGQA